MAADNSKNKIQLIVLKKLNSFDIKNELIFGNNLWNVSVSYSTTTVEKIEKTKGRFPNLKCLVYSKFQLSKYRYCYCNVRMTSKNQIIALYKALLRESQKLDAYSFRRYALRKVHDSFKANKSLNDKNVIAEKVTEAQKNLAIIKRQALISQLYSADKLVIENLEVNKQKL